MKKNLVKEWIAALRSGKYHQTKGRLCRVVKGQSFHCCLGVACRVAIKNGIKVETERGCLGGVYFDNDSEEMPIQLMDTFRLDPNDEQTLIRMNDEGQSFKEIADYIERNIL